jgi:methionyl-tRNA formyltransferase
MTVLKNKYMIATIKSWNIKNSRKFILDNPDFELALITDKNELTFDRVKEFNPRYIFFPHWSWIILKDIYENFECVVFHMTDLPFGRGGSPLQNLIERGIYQTKISAIRVDKELDGGPIYIKRDLDLHGSASEIFERASQIIFADMILYIIENEPVPVPQKGEIVVFQRRTPAQSNIGSMSNLIKVYDYIRMLDAEGYPSAFLETDNLNVEFFNAKMEKDHVLATAKIRIRNES